MAVTTEQVAIGRPEVKPRGSWERASEALFGFLAMVPPDAHHVLLCHSDADGLSSGVLMLRALERAGRGHLTLLQTDKGESAWTEGSLQQLAHQRPDALFVLDLGSRPRPIYPAVATLLIDHHRATGVPPSSTLISSYKWEPAIPTAALVYWLGSVLADLTDLDWVAASGIIGDLGTHADIAPLPTAKERYGSRALKRTTALVNAARCSASGNASVALTALLAARNPADITEGRLPEAQELARLHHAFSAALARAKRVAPVFCEQVALIQVRSAYQVHPVLAQMWSGCLPDYIVMVANEGYLPGRVSFSLRTNTDTNLLDFMQAFHHSIEATEIGYGHDKATGGSVSKEEWERLLATLGFR